MDILLESDQTTTFLLMLDGVFVEINDLIFPAARRTITVVSPFLLYEINC